MTAPSVMQIVHRMRPSTHNPRTVFTMKLEAALGIGLLAATIATAGAQTAMTGDEILARAAATDNLLSYSVPVHFAVHMRRPIGVRAKVEGIVYYKAPVETALVLTKVPSMIGGIFKGSYKLDMTPQTWSAQYAVRSVSNEQASGVPVYVLQASPKTDAPDIDHIEITITQDGYDPTSIVWFYRDKSSIRLTMVNQHLSGAALPKTESITVEMPQYGLDAVATYGDYALNAPVSDDVFRTR